VRVGTENEDYHVHEALLRNNSGFFNKALKKEWSEGQDRVVEMPETKNEAFSIWAKWLYTGHIFISKPGSIDVERRSLNELFDHEFIRWRHVYALGDFLQDADFKDALVDAMIEIMLDKEHWPNDLGLWIYEASIVGSKHRRLAVDIFVHCWSRDLFGHKKDHPKEFLVDVLVEIAKDLAKGIKKKGVVGLLGKKDGCEYHDHGSEKPCYKTKPAFWL
jgi:hypothetical protein